MAIENNMFRLSTWLCFLTYLVPVTSSSSDTFANFRRTTIISDSCDSPSKLETLTARFLTCAFWCGENKDCRRFLHSKKSLLCKLYSDGTNCVVDGDSTGYRCLIKSYGCLGDECTCPRGYYGDECTQIATDCKDYVTKGYEEKANVLVNIQPTIFSTPFEVSCWLGASAATIILKRHSTCNMVNFNRSMHEYEVGFGNVHGNRWLGFDQILPLLYGSNTRLRLEIYITAGIVQCSQYYKQFSIGNSSNQYSFYADRVQQRNSHTFCGDSIMGSYGTLNLTGLPFSTFDSDRTGGNHCPARLGGGWWFADDSNCSDSFLTGSIMTDNYWRNNLQDQSISSVLFKVAYF